VERGEIKWRDKNNSPILSVDKIRLMIRDVVLGLEYLHFQGIIHRDIKPGNLLISNNGTVKISDFGVSHLAKMDEYGNLLPENDLDLAKTAGSPAFFAPELCQFDVDKPRPLITKAIDVWALGITFFCLLFGREPFPGVYGEMELYEKICTVPIQVPEEYENSIDADAKDLLYRLLTKDPNERIGLYQVRRHPFITKDLPDPKKWAESTDLAQTSQPLQVTAQEVESAVTSFGNIVRRTLAQVKMTAKRSMSYLRPRNTTGRVLSGVSSPVSGAVSPVSGVSSPTLDSTIPDSPTRSFVSPGDRESLSSERRNSESVTTSKNDAGIHAFFHFGSSAVRAVNAPPTPPHSAKVDTVFPNGHVNGHIVETVVPIAELPPLVNMTDAHLADDYSNLYYSEEDEDDLDSEEVSDDERLEMKFNSKKIRV
jgi:serine/threonine protein kinase